MRQFCSVAWLALTYLDLGKFLQSVMFFITQYFMLLFRLETAWIQPKCSTVACGDLLFNKGWMKLVSVRPTKG